MDTDTFDIRSYLYYMNVPIWEAGPNVSPGWIGIGCIYCGDHHNHLGISLYQKNFTCWLCKQRGDIFRLIQDIEGVDWHKAMERIGEFQELYPTEISDKEHLEDEGQDILPEDCTDELSQAQKAYLRGRRYSPKMLGSTWGIKSGPMFGRWKYRIIIPVTLGGRALSFIGLDHTETNKIKYKAAASEESIKPTSKLLYGYDQANPGISTRKSVVVVEGITDVWRIGKGAVATLGMGVSPTQVSGLLMLQADHYHIMFDGEPIAIHNAHKLGQSLRFAGKDVEVIELGSGDPDNLPDDEVDVIRHELGLD